MPREAKIMIAIAAVVVAGGIALILQNNPSPAEPGKPVDEKSLVREDSHMTGGAAAKVTLVEFGDYQCPACAIAQPVVLQILESYRGNPDFNFVFRHFPLNQHKNARLAAQAAEAAGEQGKYWEMHERIYEGQERWANLGSADALVIFVNYASEVGLDTGQFEAAVKNEKFSAVINAGQNDGLSLGVNSTPTFFLNGERLTGIPTVDGLKALIEARLSQ